MTLCRVSFFLIPILGHVSFGFMYGDKCTILPQGFIPDGEIRDYNVPQNCLNGTIDWNYPKESIRIHFREPNSRFVVCIYDAIGGDMLTLDDLTSGIRRLPSIRDSPSCLYPKEGEAVLKLSAPDFQTYVAAVNYVISVN